MSSADVWLLVSAAALVLLAGLFSAADAALGSFSPARATELAAEDRAGAKRLLALLEDPPRHLNTVLLLRLACEVTAIVLATRLVRQGFAESWLVTGLVTVAVMLVVSFVFIGVAPRTLGRQHSESVALVAAGPVSWFTRVLGPLPRLLILLGNALTPGRGFREGPFSSEAELRELVDLAEERQVIESGEREMIHSVFELGDTLVREVMVPRTDMVWIERTKTVRQGLSLAMRSGFSRIPVIGDNEDDIVGFAYLKDLAKRVYEDDDRSEKVDEVMRPATFVPESKPVDELLREMQTKQVHVAVVIDEYGGTAGLVTIEDILEEIVGEITDEYDREAPRIEELGDGSLRVPVRMPIDDIEDMYDVSFDLEDVETVGGLLASALGRVPIPGTSVTLQGLTFSAESAKGRRNRVGTVLISRSLAPDR
jgi:CBS domain containing-hemolysin-like protein